MSTPPLARADASRADVVVLGAGIIGAAIARELAVAGLDVVVVEADAPGGGTSGRCDGNILVQTKLHAPELVLTRRAIERFRDWVDELDHPIHFDQVGSMVFFTDDDQLAAGRDRVQLLAELGVQSELLDEAEVREREPALDGPLIGGIDCLEDASVYPPYVVYALLADAVARGARLVGGTRARRVLSQHGRVTGVETDRGVIHSDWVINALGIWSASLAAHTGIELPIQPRQGVLLVTEERPGLIRRSVTEGAYMTLRGKGAPSDPRPQPVFVAEPTFRGNILIGSSRRFVGESTAVEPELLLALAARAAHYASALGDVAIIRSFAGLRPWTPDNYPIVGEAGDLDGYVLATGHEGEGIALAPVTADMVTRIVTGAEREAALTEAFRLFDPVRLRAEESVEVGR